jgi:hypothetical protein
MKPINIKLNQPYQEAEVIVDYPNGSIIEFYMPESGAYSFNQVIVNSLHFDIRPIEEERNRPYLIHEKWFNPKNLYMRILPRSRAKEFKKQFNSTL